MFRFAAPSEDERLASTARLCAAVCAGHAAEAVRLVLEEGADPNALDVNGLSAVHYAAASGDTSLVRLLCGPVNVYEFTPSHARMAHAGHLPAVPSVVAAELAVELLASLGVDVNNADDSGSTPVAAAASDGHASVVAALLEWGADAMAVDKAGRTAMFEAAEKSGSSALAVLAASAAASAVELGEDFNSCV